MDEGKIQNLDQLQYEMTEIFDISQNIVTAIAISNDDKLLAFCSNRIGFQSKFAIKIWKIREKKILLELKGPFYVYYAVFSNNNKILAAAGQKPYDIFVYNIQNTSYQQPISIIRRNQSNVHRFIFTLDNQQLISCSQDNYLQIWNVAHQKKINIKWFISPIYDISISKSGYIGICQHNGNAMILSRHMTINHVWKAHKEKSFSILFIQDSTIIVTSGGYEVKFWLLSDLLKDKNIFIRSINFSDSPELWVLKVYPPLNPKIIITYNGQIEWISLDSELSIVAITMPGGLWNKPIAISSDIKFVFSGSLTNTIRMYQRKI